jgi:hypothetical protein
MKKFGDAPIGLMIVLTLFIIIDFYISTKCKKKSITNSLRLIFLGGIKGLFMGYIANGFEGALVGSLLLGTLNPIIYSIESILVPAIKI